jgi:hypothetical protein
METNKDFICINAWVVILETTAIIFLLLFMCMLLWGHVFDTQDDLCKLKKTHAAVVKELSELKRTQVVSPPPPPAVSPPPRRPDLHPPSYCQNDRLAFIRRDGNEIFGEPRPSHAPPSYSRNI